MPFNRSLTVVRAGTSLAAGLSAFVLPASAETQAFFGTPGQKLFSIYLPDLPDVQEQDELVCADPAETYQVKGVQRFDTLRLPHLELVCTAKWGT